MPTSGNRRGRGHPRGALTAGLVVGLLTSAAQAQTYTGREVADATAQSLDMMRDHVAFLAAQDRYDASLAYITLGFRGAPARFAYNDGRTPWGAAVRGGTTVGFGFGAPSELSVFTGAWVDLVQAGAFEPNAGLIKGVEGLLYLGVGFRGFQLTVARYVHGDPAASGDGFGNLSWGSDAQTGGPGEATSLEPSEQRALTLYHTSGASVLATWAVVPSADLDGTHYELVEARAQLQPLKRWLDKKYGLPMLALQKLSGDRGYYGEPPPQRATAASPGQAEASAPPSPYETELGSDDLLGLGIRAHTKVQLYPTPKFRTLEAGAYRDKGPWTVAFRAHVYRRLDTTQASVDSFGAFRIGDPKPGNIGLPFSVALSYSYNSPDTATFIPLPYAHVVGVQAVLGVPEVAKSLVPIVRAKEEPAP